MTISITHASPASRRLGAPTRLTAMPLAWVATCRRLLVVGGGFETEARIRHALLFDWLAISVVVARSTPALRAFARQDLRVALHERPVLAEDIAQADFVLEDSGSVDDALRIRAWCDEYHKPLNACDKPDLCDAYYMSLVLMGPLCLGISSGGDAPAVTAALRRWMEEHLSPGWATAARVMGELRGSLPSGQPRIDLIKNIARHDTFLGLVENNDEDGLRGLIADALRRMPT